MAAADERLDEVRAERDAFTRAFQAQIDKQYDIVAQILPEASDL